MRKMPPKKPEADQPEPQPVDLEENEILPLDDVDSLLTEMDDDVVIDEPDVAVLVDVSLIALSLLVSVTLVYLCELLPAWLSLPVLSR